MHSFGKISLPSLILLVALVLIMPRERKFGKEYAIGQPWKYETLTADFDFPLLKTDEQLLKEREEAMSESILYFRYEDGIAPDNIEKLYRLNISNPYRNLAASSLEEIYSIGVLPDQFFDSEPNRNQDIVYVQRDRKAEKCSYEELYSISKARARLLRDMQAVNPSSDTLDFVAGMLECISPNLLLDEVSTDLINSEKLSEISATDGYVPAGKIIISKGETVTAEKARMLDSYREEFEDSVGSSVSTTLFWFGNVIVALAMVVLLLFIIYFSNKEIFEDSGRFLYLLVIFYIAAFVAIIVTRLNPSAVFLVPFTLSALYLQAFFLNKVIVPVYIISLIPLLLFSSNGLVLFVMFSLAGVIGIYFFKIYGRGWQQFITALITFGVLAVMYLGFQCTGYISGPLYRNLLYLFIGSMLTVAGYPLIYLFEKIFNLVSSSRLAELCDTSNPILRELETKAPGTFQHSLQVMNMADAAARAIGANEQLVKAAALYHDIGKMNNPLCFIENESLQHLSENESYHSDLNPLHSAQDVIRHVADGEEIARKHRLPRILIDFILTHHGTTRTGYFLNKYLNDGGDPSRIDEFSYAGPPPSTKEQIILMLCDSVEAASRTLKDKNFDAFIEKIVADKMSAGQFENADISIMELGIVKDALKSYLAQLYHNRIEYPKRNKKS